jgi:predicted secreted Zn-dependent protease
MKIMHVMASLLLVSSLATPTTAQERTHKSVTRAQTYRIEGRQIAAPPWSAACMTDHGPSDRAIQECVLTCSRLLPMTSGKEKTCTSIVFNPETPRHFCAS